MEGRRGGGIAGFPVIDSLRSARGEKESRADRNEFGDERSVSLDLPDNGGLSGRDASLLVLTCRGLTCDETV